MTSDTGNHSGGGSKQGGSTPFEWLSGGLFFGGKSAKGGLESIDTSKNPATLLRGIAENINTLLRNQGEKDHVTESKKESEEKGSQNFASEPSNAEFLAARLSRLRFLLYDERRRTSQESRRAATVVATTVQTLMEDDMKDLIPKLVENIILLPFESRKGTASMFVYLLVSGLDGLDAELYIQPMERFRDYVESNFERIMTAIVKGHDISSHGESDVGLHYGSMYRACLRHASLYEQLVGSTERAELFVFPFLDIYVHVPNFDISSDAMESLRVVFTAGGDQIRDESSQQIMAEIAADLFIRDYEELWDKRFSPKLLSPSANYMTRRVALQILSSVLLTRSNYAVMIRYVADRSNLKLIMHLLRDTSPHITLDAFHVFKVFVANPNKPSEVVRILKDNQVKLCKYLSTLHQDKEASDTQFRDEKALIISTIEAL